MVTPIATEFVRAGPGGWLDADLIRGVTDRIVIDRVQVVGGTILQIEYRMRTTHGRPSTSSHLLVVAATTTRSRMVMLAALPTP